MVGNQCTWRWPSLHGRSNVRATDPDTDNACELAADTDADGEFESQLCIDISGAPFDISDVQFDGSDL